MNIRMNTYAAMSIVENQFVHPGPYMFELTKVQDKRVRIKFV